MDVYNKKSFSPFFYSIVNVSFNIFSFEKSDRFYIRYIFPIIASPKTIKIKPSINLRLFSSALIKD